MKSESRAAALWARHLERLRALLTELVPGNRFYAPRLREAGLSGSLESLEAFQERMPFTEKAELVRDQAEHPPYGTNLTRELSAYARLHQTSSTTGAPLRWLDTPESWAWMVSGWREVLRGAGVTSADRVFVAFSFGPFIGLWLAFDAATSMGCLTIPGGALNSEKRLQALLANDVDVLCCTPTYALRLAEVARESGIDLSAGSVRTIVVGGEPGASVPATRALIEDAWPGARLHDHYGMTELGPVTWQCREDAGRVHVLDELHLCEVVDPETGAPAPADGERTGELVVTNLGRVDAPVLRYRTRDIVRPAPPGTCACGHAGLSFLGGIVGRADDMVVVRGVNLFPTAVDQVVRACEGVAEYRVKIRTERGMSELELEVEPGPGSDAKALGAALEAALKSAFSLRIPVTTAAPGSLPRFDLKARRWVRA